MASIVIRYLLNCCDIYISFSIVYIALVSDNSLKSVGLHLFKLPQSRVSDDSFPTLSRNLLISANVSRVIQVCLFEINQYIILLNMEPCFVWHIPGDWYIFLYYLLKIAIWRSLYPVYNYVNMSCLLLSNMALHNRFWVSKLFLKS